MFAIKKISPFIFFLLLINSGIDQVFSRSVEKQSVLAVLTLNIARFTIWPEFIFNNTESTLNMCIYGDNVIHQAFESIDNKVINNNSTTINIINLSKLHNLNRCQLLYLGELKQNKLAHLLIELKTQPILTIGETMAFIQAGGMIRLENNKGKIQLTINLPRVKQAQLIISSRLLKLAKIVNAPLSDH